MACEKQLHIFVGANPIAVFNFLCSQRVIANDYQVEYTDYQNYVVHLKRGMNLVSWGENITIRIYSAAGGITRIVIDSKPKMPTTLVDWGQNQNNVNNIAQYICSYFPQASPPPV